MNIQVKIDDKIAREYDHPVIVMVFNNESCEIIGPKVIMDDAEKYGDQVHLVLALHHCLANNPEIINQAIEAFDSYVTKESEAIIDKIQ